MSEPIGPWARIILDLDENDFNDGDDVLGYLSGRLEDDILVVTYEGEHADGKVVERYRLVREAGPW